MKIRTVLNSVLTVAMIGYVISIGMTRDPFLFMMLFPIALLFAIFFCVINIRNKKNFYTVLGCLIFFFAGGWVINHYCFPHPFHPISVLGDVGIVVFTVFLGWSFRKRHKKGILGVGTASFMLFIVLLMAVSSITQRASEPSSIAALQSLPYLSYVVEEKAADKDGVVTYYQSLCNPGMNIYSSRGLRGAYLMDMSGNRSHIWLPKDSHSDWMYVTMDNEGDLLVSIEDITLMRLDWDSQIQWETHFRSHHDIAIAENNDIYTLARKDELVFISGFLVPILNDYLVVLSPDGTTQKEVSLFNILKQEIPVDRILEMYAGMIVPQTLWGIIKEKIGGRFIFNDDTGFDILHNNTLTIIDRNMNGLCKKGDILVAVRQLDLIGIVDIDQEQLLWSWGPGNLEKPHHPTLLENGNILIFDNGPKRGYSRLIELDPFTKEMIWQYEASPPTSFFSGVMGAAQRLPNGNTLITESSKGRVFEITKDGEIVWEFYNPDRHEDGKRATIYRMMRITDPENYSKLEGLQ